MMRPLTAAALEPLSGIAHGFFTRSGGMSTGLYASLNCGLGSADAADAVTENRARAVRCLGLRPDSLVTAYQIHSAEAVIVDRAWQPGSAPKADALATNQPGICLGILTADCVPILFADPIARVIGAAHAGWKGALEGVAEAAVDAMVRLGARTGQIHAAIGPAIRQASYEVGPEFPERFADGPAFFRPSSRTGHLLFDLPGYVRARLHRLGLAAIEDLEHDTAAEATDFFSYRRATLNREPDYGRQLSAIALV